MATRNPLATAFQSQIVQRLRQRAALLIGTEREVIALLKTAQQQITERLAAQPTDYERWQLPQLLTQIEATLQGATTSGATKVDQALRTAWQQGEDFVDKPLAAGGQNVELRLPLLDTQVLTALRSFTTERIKDIGSQALASINQALGLVTLGAVTPFDAMKRVQAVLGDTGTRRATTIVRTELGRAFALASEQRLEQAAQLVPGLQKQWRRSGKLHSRTNHDAIDGQLVDAGKPFRLLGASGGIVRMMHPHDPKAPIEEVINCGCIALPRVPGLAPAIPAAKPYTDEEIKRDGRKARAAMVAGRQPARQTAGDNRPMSKNALKNAGKAVIPKAKLVDYALSASHERGQHKARLFESVLGINAKNYQLLEQQVREKLPTVAAVAGSKDVHGQRYSVDLPVTGPGGSGIVVTAWIIRPGSDVPELTSIRVKKPKS